MKNPRLILCLLLLFTFSFQMYSIRMNALQVVSQKIKSFKSKTQKLSPAKQAPALVKVKNQNNEPSKTKFTHSCFRTLATEKWTLDVPLFTNTYSSEFYLYQNPILDPFVPPPKAV